MQKSVRFVYKQMWGVSTEINELIQSALDIHTISDFIYYDSEQSYTIQKIDVQDIQESIFIQA